MNKTNQGNNFVYLKENEHTSLKAKYREIIRYSHIQIPTFKIVLIESLVLEFL